MNRFTLSNLPLSDLKLINRQSIGESRGFFLVRLFFEEISATQWSQSVAQINLIITAHAALCEGCTASRFPHSNETCNLYRGEVLEVSDEFERCNLLELGARKEDLLIPPIVVEMLS
jgi:dTDP-4-dehydrorhamnose 3,5-epimerase